MNKYKATAPIGFIIQQVGTKFGIGSYPTGYFVERL